LFFNRQAEKPVKPNISVSKDSPGSGLSPKDSHGNEANAKCASERLQEKPEKQEGNPNKKKVLSNYKNSGIKHTEPKCGGGKGKRVISGEELLPAKKRKRIVVISDSEESSDDGE
jgi:hypothetical protein